MNNSLQLLISNALTLVFITVFLLLTANELGPEKFGNYAAAQAIAVMLMPIFSLRLETRIAICENDEELRDLITATVTSSLFFTIVAVFGLTLLSFWVDITVALIVILLSLSTILADFGLSRLAFLRRHNLLSIHRFMRQVFPLVLGFLAAFISNQYEIALLALMTGTFIWALILNWQHIKNSFWSLKIFKRVWGQHGNELKASITFGTLNNIWLNCLQPLMALMGWYQLAGQYALLQRLINGPLSVLTIVTNTLLLAKGNILHLDAKKVFKTFSILFLIGALWVLCLWVLLFLQEYWILPPEWKIDLTFFHAAAFFGVSSFAVGALSIVSIRLKDEWFMAFWQLLFIFIWCVAVVMMDLQQIFALLLWIGGLAYIVLLWRWMLQISLKKNSNVIK